MTKSTRVLVNGANGKMGQETVKTINEASQFELVAATDIDDNVEETCQRTTPDVIIDFTHPDGLKERINTYIRLGIHAIIGTTGLTQKDQDEIDSFAKKNTCIILICPNFSISALLMMKYSAEAAKYMPNVEIIEYHHNQKADAPSGTAIKTADWIQKQNPSINTIPLPEKQIAIGSRGAKTGTIPIHAVRLPGYVADQDVILGGDDQTLLIRQTTLSRKAFMPGVRLAVEKYTQLPSGLHYGLELLLFD